MAAHSYAQPTNWQRIHPPSKREGLIQATGHQACIFCPASLLFIAHNTILGVHAAHRILLSQTVRATAARGRGRAEVLASTTYDGSGLQDTLGGRARTRQFSTGFFCEVRDGLGRVPELRCRGTR